MLLGPPRARHFEFRWRFSPQISACPGEGRKPSAGEGMMTLPLGLVLALTLMTQDERPHMSVVLCDQIGMDALTWSTAKTQASRVFDQAGVRLEGGGFENGSKQCIPPS